MQLNLPSNALKEINRLRTMTCRMVTGELSGSYKSRFRGRGIELEEVREYQPGDDVRFIDWNVTARTGRPYVKMFKEERELTVMLALDISPSLNFGTVRQYKKQLAAELCAFLSMIAVNNNDRVGLLLFTDRVEKFVPPQKGIDHAIRMIRDALYFTPSGKGTDISVPLEHINRVVRRRAVTFLLSDFYAPEFKRSLSISAKRHEIIAVSITDRAEYELPDMGIIRFDDLETGNSLLMDASHTGTRIEYAANALERKKVLEELFKSVGVDYLEISTETSYPTAFMKFFNERKRRP